MNATCRMKCARCGEETIHTALKCCHCSNQAKWPKITLAGFIKQTLLGRPERKRSI